MMLAIEPADWKPFDRQSPAQLTALLTRIAAYTKPRKYRKHPCKPKTKRKPGYAPRAAVQRHVSTARVLRNGGVRPVANQCCKPVIAFTHITYLLARRRRTRALSCSGPGSSQRLQCCKRLLKAVLRAGNRSALPARAHALSLPWAGFLSVTGRQSDRGPVMAGAALLAWAGSGCSALLASHLRNVAADMPSSVAQASSPLPLAWPAWISSMALARISAG